MENVFHVSSLLGLAFLSTPLGFSSEPAPSAQQSQFEIRFVEAMIDHHQLGLGVAQLCLSRALHPELRQTCQNIIATKTSEILLMQSWLHIWYGVSHTPTALARDGMILLERSQGAEFEVAFMQWMSEHHAEAIRQSTDCLVIAYHQELRDLCERMMTAQAHEINLFRAWLCQWYLRCEAI